MIKYYEDNPKGKRTWEWKQDDKRQISVYFRKKGETGSHFHKGEDPSKNPEEFLLVSGKMRFKLTDKNLEETKFILDATQKPIELIISPYVLHEYEVLEDSLYIKYRLTWFNHEKPDTFPAEEFFKELAKK